MNMNLLIVDDEFFCCEKIRTLLSSHKMPDIDIREADDGINALTICERGFSPDIVFTDVRMPRMNGIDLAFELRARYPDCIIVFMSGYSDKEYLKSAIMVGAVGYIEKPFFAEEFNQVLNSALEKHAKAIYHGERDEMHRLFLSQAGANLLESQPDCMRVRERLRKIGVDFPLNGFYAAVLLEAPSDFLKSDRTAWESPGMLPAIADGQYVFLAYDERRNIMQGYLQSFYIGLIHRAEAQGITIRAGIGGIKSAPDALYTSYQEARQALCTEFFDRTKNIFYFSQLACCAYHFEPGLLDEFAHLIEDRNFNAAHSFLEKVTQDIRHCTATRPASVRDFYFRLLLKIVDHAKALYPGEFVDQPEIANAWLAIESASDVDTLCNYLVRVLDLYGDFLESKSGQRGYADLAIAWIHRNYADKALSLNQIALGISISPAYLSTLFKMEKGVSITRYINEYRIEQACRLLRSGPVRISQVADQTGYADRVYFAKTFRKITGMTPKEYREARP